MDNPANVSYGRLPGFGLTTRGRRQAQRTGTYLLRRADAPLIIASSPLQRAVETATIIQHTCFPTQGRSTSAGADNAAPPDGTPRQAAAPNSTPFRHDHRLIEAGSWIEGLPRTFAPAAYLRAALDPYARAKSEPAAVIAARMRAAIFDAIARAQPFHPAPSLTAPPAASPNAAKPAAADAPAVELILVSHQSPIRLARASFERSLPASRGPSRAALRHRLRRRLLRPPCSHASVTTLLLAGDTLRALDYWAP